MVLLQIENSMSKVVDYTLVQYGALGLLIIILCGVTYGLFRYIERQSTTHQDERKEWRDEISKQHDETLSVSKNATEVMNDIKTIVTVINDRK